MKRPQPLPEKHLNPKEFTEQHNEMSGIFKQTNIGIILMIFLFLPNRIVPSLSTYWSIFTTYLMTLCTNKMKLTSVSKVSSWIAIEEFQSGPNFSVFGAVLTQAGSLRILSHKITHTASGIMGPRRRTIISFHYYPHPMTEVQLFFCFIEDNAAQRG